MFVFLGLRFSEVFWAFWLVGFFEWPVGGYPSYSVLFLSSLEFLMSSSLHSQGVEYKIRFYGGISKVVSHSVQWVT